jgi:hypothetical protein
MLRAAPPDTDSATANPLALQGTVASGASSADSTNHSPGKREADSITRGKPFGVDVDQAVVVGSRVAEEPADERQDPRLGPYEDPTTGHVDGPHVHVELKKAPCRGPPTGLGGMDDPIEGAPQGTAPASGNLARPVYGLGVAEKPLSRENSVA